MTLLNAAISNTDPLGAAATGASAIRAQALGRSIDDRAILHDLNFDIPPQSYIALIGHNGAGKSTLLHILATLSTATTGKLHLFGEQVTRGTPAIRRRIGMIGHQPMLYRDLTAMENLVFFGKLYGIPHPARRAAQLLEQVSLADRALDPARTFSRGMTQRLAIARALMHDPQLLLADEPFSGLDLASSRALEKLLAQLHAAGKTIVLTHHDIAQSLSLAQRVIILRRGRIALDQWASNITVQTAEREVSAP